MDEAVNERISSLVNDNHVVLFMKGNKSFPQCGFSGSTVAMLNECGVDFETVDVLKDPEIRQGIKEFSDWPTIPQLFIAKEFVGGSDIVRSMFDSGELQSLLGIEEQEVAVPIIRMSQSCKELFLGVEQKEEGVLRFQVSPNFEYQIGFGDAADADIVVDTDGIPIHLDRASAKRANGVSFDFIEGEEGGVVIDNPNEPAQVQQMSVAELKAAMDADKELELFDVRTDEEREIAIILGAKHLTPELVPEVEGLDKSTLLVFHCHHGGRSQSAAEHFVQAGFRKVYNLSGGIDTWSLQIDSAVARY
jgi:monothiol glutaredoxin